MTTQPQSYRGSHLAKSNDYHQIFESMPRAAMLWTLEKRVLGRIMSQNFGMRRPEHLDFACGTGRILAFLEPFCMSSTGVDVSESMLSVARENSPFAEVMHTDITRGDALAGRKFDIITAFRFFPNAEQALRFEVIDALAGLLRPSGILILNNHLNASATLRIALKASGRQTGHSMKKAEVRELLERVGLRATHTVGIGILPVTDRYVVAPRTMTRIEWTLTRTRAFTRFAEDEIFVASHPGAV